MKRFVIVGLGNFGSGVAEALYRRGHDVIAVDTDEDTVDRIAPHTSRAAVGDARQIEVLRQVGAADANTAIVSTGDDMTASMLSVLALMDLGVDDIYVKVISGDHARIMNALGVSETIFPERESAFNLASRISEYGVLNYVRMAGDLSVQEMVVLDEWEGETLRDISVRDRYHVTVVAVHNTRDDSVTVPPDPDAPLQATDTLLLAGTEERLEEIADLADQEIRNRGSGEG
jgi:trk system potassium uptake protein TrkA